MKVKTLRVQNFRNLKSSSIEIPSDIVFIIGNNGQGKTSLIEAISFLATCRSFRSHKNDEVVSWGESSSLIEAKLSDTSWEADLKTVFLKNEGTSTKRTSFINGKAFHSSSKYLEHRFGSERVGFHAIVFNPSDHDLVRGEPSLRRNYIDRVISAENSAFLQVVKKYQRVLLQKNALLKNDESPDLGLLRGFNELLAKLGAEIISCRMNWLEKVKKPLDDFMRHIAPDQLKTKIFYHSRSLKKIFKNEWLDPVHFTGQGVQASLQNLEQVLLEQYSELERVEIQSQTTLIGPHRDDWQFFIGEMPLKGHGSQGEVRSSLLGLKQAEIELFKKATGHQPVLLLDDFSSELDESRRQYLMDSLFQSGLQVFVTTTDKQSIFRSDAAVFVIEKGQVVGAKNDNSNFFERERLFSGQN